MKYLLHLLISTLLLSCQSPASKTTEINTNKLIPNQECSSSVDILFKNKSSGKTSLTLSNGADTVIIEAGGNQTVKNKLCFDKVLRADGNYFVRLTSAAKDTAFFWGYYTNGHPSEKVIEVTYNSAGILFKSDL